MLKSGVLDKSKKITDGKSVFGGVAVRTGGAQVTIQVFDNVSSSGERIMPDLVVGANTNREFFPPIVDCVNGIYMRILPAGAVMPGVVVYYDKG